MLLSGVAPMPKPGYVAPSREGLVPANRLRQAGDAPSPQDRSRSAQHHGWPDHGDCHCQCPEEVCQGARSEPMSKVTIYDPRVPSIDAGAGGRLYAAFLARRSPPSFAPTGQTLREGPQITPDNKVVIGRNACTGSS